MPIPLGTDWDDAATDWDDPATDWDRVDPGNPPPPPPPPDPVDPPPTPVTSGIWSVTVNGVTIGIDPYHFGEDGPDLFGWDSMRTADDPNPSDHGDLSANPDKLPALDKDIPIIVLGDTQAQVLQRWKALATAWAPSASLQMMDLSTPDGHYQLFGRPRRIGKPNMKYLVSGNAILSALRYVATDPRFYSESKTVVGTVAVSTGGLAMPMGFPHGFGAPNAGGVTVNNEGNTPTRRITVIITAGSGGLTNPRLELDGSGLYIAANMTILEGQALWLDFMAETVRLNNTASRGGSVERPGSSFFSVPPGVHQISLGGSGVATISVTYRSASLF